jgi:alpha-beta hydrolase superfamily lysophospholipase
MISYYHLKKQIGLGLNLGLVTLLLVACGDDTVAPTGSPAPTGITTPPANTSAPGTSAGTTAPATTAGTTVAATTAATTLAATTLPPTTSIPTTAPGTTSAPTTGPTGTTEAAATSQGATGQEQEVTFTSQGDTIYGTLLKPTGGSSGKMPVALIIAGSGPTDRDGNSALISGKIDNLKYFAQVLAANGIASLRYDKIATGKTGLGHLASNPTSLDFQVYVDEARAAYDYLKAQPDFDPQRIMILGHSEGGLIGLILADQLKTSQEIKALVLASPISRPYLQTIHDQLTAQYNAAVKAGAVTQAQADAALTELDQINKSLLETGKYPATINTPALKQIYAPVNEKFLGDVAKYDPQQIAAGLPTSLPVLAMCGSKDQQISCDDVGYLMQGFQKAGNTKASLAVLANVDHVYKEVPGTPNPNTDYNNPNLKFSQEAATKLGDFIKSGL